MTFDQAYEAYKEARRLLRETQGELAKFLHNREKLDKDIEQLVKKYKSRYTDLILAQDILKPELDKEVSSHTKPAKYKEAETETEPDFRDDIIDRKADENGQTKG